MLMKHAQKHTSAPKVEVCVRGLQEQPFEVAMGAAVECIMGPMTDVQKRSLEILLKTISCPDYSEKDKIRFSLWLVYEHARRVELQNRLQQ